MISVCDVTINCYGGVRDLSNYRVIDSKNLISMHLDSTSPDWAYCQHAISILN